MTFRSFSDIFQTAKKMTIFRTKRSTYKKQSKDWSYTMLKKLFMMFCLCFIWQAPAQAKGLLVFNTGDEMFKVGAFPQELVSQYEDLKSLNVGYKCSHFGILWADVRTWDCTLVGMTDAEPDTFYELPEDVIASLGKNPDYQENKMQRNFWNHYGIFILVLAIIGLIVMGRKAKD